jgi:alpha-beta hydrolase superfamily lysophospholipase
VGQFSISTTDGHSLTVHRWEPDALPKAIVQIAHGAAEHMGRYDRLARFLIGQGHAVLGADHRGHGANIGPGIAGDLGPGGFAAIVDDLRAVTDAARARYPDRPIVLLGHSFGSFAAQVYLLKHAEAIDGLVLSGTAAIDMLLAGADLSSGMTSANAAFEPSRTPFDWLSRDEREVDAYIADPLCGFELKPESLATMGAVASDAMRDPDLAVAAAKGLPVLIISGELDPIVGPEQCLSRLVAARYRDAGLRDVQHRIYQGGRHEMFNEINRDEVMLELAGWLDQHF